MYMQYAHGAIGYNGTPMNIVILCIIRTLTEKNKQ